MQRIRQPTPDLLIIDISERWYLTIPLLACSLILFSHYPFSVLGIGVVAASALATVLILSTRHTIEFNRNLKIATWRRRYLIQLAPVVYDLTRFDGLSVETMQKEMCCVTLSAPTVSVVIAEYREQSKPEAIRLAELLAEFTKLNIIAPRQRRIQFHLATAFILMIAAGILIGLYRPLFALGMDGTLIAVLAIASLMCLWSVGSQIESFFRRREIRSAKPETPQPFQG